MANTCTYEMRLAGERQNVIDVLHFIEGHGPLVESKEEVFDRNIGKSKTIDTLEPCYVGRCGYDSSPIKIVEKDGKMYAELDDECAWSVISSMIDREESGGACKSLTTLAAKYDVKMEIYSIECGVGFSEYYFFPGKDTAEEGYSEDNFEHTGVSDALQDDGLTVNDDGEWVDSDGNVIENAFEDKVMELFPWEWRQLNGDEWFEEGKTTDLGNFIKEFRASWE